MEDAGRELREAIERSREGHGRWRCPEGLRSEIVSYVQRGRESGATLSSLAALLGVSEVSISRWLQQKSGDLQRVEVTESKTSSVGLTLVTPRGYRIEGLCVESAAVLLSRL